MHDDEWTVEPVRIGNQLDWTNQVVEKLGNKNSTDAQQMKVVKCRNGFGKGDGKCREREWQQKGKKSNKRRKNAASLRSERRGGKRRKWASSNNNQSNPWTSSSIPDPPIVVCNQLFAVFFAECLLFPHAFLLAPFPACNIPKHPISPLQQQQAFPLPLFPHSATIIFLPTTSLNTIHHLFHSSIAIVLLQLVFLLHLFLPSHFSLCSHPTTKIALFPRIL